MWNSSRYVIMLEIYWRNQFTNTHTICYKWIKSQMDKAGSENFPCACLPITISDESIYLVRHARKIKHKKKEKQKRRARERYRRRHEKIIFAWKIWKICVICLMESFHSPLYCKNVTNITQKFLMKIWMCVLFSSRVIFSFFDIHTAKNGG